MGAKLVRCGGCRRSVPEGSPCTHCAPRGGPTFTAGEMRAAATRVALPGGGELPARAERDLRGVVERTGPGRGGARLGAGRPRQGGIRVTLILRGETVAALDAVAVRDGRSRGAVIDALFGTGPRVLGGTAATPGHR